MTRTICYSPVYDLNAGSGGNYIKLDANLSSGSGAGDMVALIPVSALGTDLTQYVYLYSEFGVHNANTSGFEEWDYGAALPVGSISGQVFNDVNGNGKQDTGDKGLAGITVFLDANNNGCLTPARSRRCRPATERSLSPTLLLGRITSSRCCRRTNSRPAGSMPTSRCRADRTPRAWRSATFWAAASAARSIEDTTGNGFSSDDPVLNSANPDSVPGDCAARPGVDRGCVDVDRQQRELPLHRRRSRHVHGPGGCAGRLDPNRGDGCHDHRHERLSHPPATTSTTSSSGTIAGTLYQDLTGDGTTSLEVLNQNDPNYVPVTVQLYLGSSGDATGDHHDRHERQLQFRKSGTRHVHDRERATQISIDRVDPDGSVGSGLEPSDARSDRRHGHERHRLDRQ